MLPPVEYHYLADREIIRAHARYLRDGGAIVGSNFLLAMDQAIHRVSTMPKSCSPHLAGTRMVRVRRPHALEPPTGLLATAAPLNPHHPRYRFTTFSSISCLPDAFACASPFFSMYASRLAKSSFPASMVAPMPVSQLP